MDGVEAQLTAEHDRAAKCIYGARAARDFADGFIAALLPVYLAQIGLGALQIGLVATLGLLGSASMTLGMGLLGARLCQRTLLMAASVLMVATGVACALSGTYLVVVLAALLGSLNSSSSSVSIFVPIDHAVLARATPAVERTRMFARYGLIGAFAAAALW
jgi:MFS family permease